MWPVLHFTPFEVRMGFTGKPKKRVKRFPLSVLLNRAGRNNSNSPSKSELQNRMSSTKKHDTFFGKNVANVTGFGFETHVGQLRLEWG